MKKFLPSATCHGKLIKWHKGLELCYKLLNPKKDLNIARYIIDLILSAINYKIAWGFYKMVYTFTEKEQTISILAEKTYEYLLYCIFMCKI